MILGVLSLLGMIFGVTSGAVDIGNYVNDHPFGQLAPGTPEWKAACKNAFKSFDADDGTWKDYQGVYHPCRIKIVRR